MLAPNDSSAALSIERQFAQHQAVVTILQGILPNPHLYEFKWLDLACGNGQIIMHLERNLHESLIEKIEYFGYDIKEEYLKTAQKKASDLNLKKYEFQTGEISNFQMLYNKDQKFDCITLTNVIHEINPNVIPSLLYESFIRLKDNGFLFIYDMDRIDPPELGAITWNNLEFDEILSSFFASMNTEYLPSSGQWLHSSCNGWNIQLKREFFDIDLQFVLNNKSVIIEKTQECVKTIVNRKCDNCIKALNSFTNYGMYNTQEKLEVEEYLFQFWALSKAKEGF